MIHPLPARTFTSEYIELYNNGSQVIALQNYTLRVANVSIPLGNYFLAPKQYMLLAPAGAASQFDRYGNVMPLQTWRALNNTSGMVALLNSEQVLIDHVPYSNRWYGDPQKRNGGWSLERINPNLPCNNAHTWRASEAAHGGTPGQKNSVWDDRYVPPITLRLQTITDSSIVLNVAPLASDLSFGSNPQIVIEPGEVPIRRYIIEADKLTLYPSAPIPWDMPVNLRINALHYCGQPQTINIPLFRSSAVLYNDLIINEVLFNPKTNGVTFVELYNRSDKIINLRNWRIGNRVISTEDLLVEPDGYRVLTSSAQHVKQDYPHAVIENFIAMQDLPRYPNERGFVLLYKGNELVDSLYYQSTMHQPFLANVRGISLERQSSEEDTNAHGNFSSASSLAGGATPGYQNSTAVEKKAEKNTWQLDQKTFSPSGNGSADLLRFRYVFAENNPMLNLTIYDSNGRVVNRLIRSKSAGSAGEITWDGRHESGTRCPPGIYIYHTELYTAEGQYQQFKGSFVLVEAGK